MFAKNLSIKRPILLDYLTPPNTFDKTYSQGKHESEKGHTWDFESAPTISYQITTTFKQI